MFFGLGCLRFFLGQPFFANCLCRSPQRDKRKFLFVGNRVVHELFQRLSLSSARYISLRVNPYIELMYAVYLLDLKVKFFV